MKRCKINCIKTTKAYGRFWIRHNSTWEVSVYLCEIRIDWLQKEKFGRSILDFITGQEGLGVFSNDLLRQVNYEGKNNISVSLEEIYYRRHYPIGFLVIQRLSYFIWGQDSDLAKEWRSFAILMSQFQINTLPIRTIFSLASAFSGTQQFSSKVHSSRFWPASLPENKLSFWS